MKLKPFSLYTTQEKIFLRWNMEGLSMILEGFMEMALMAVLPGPVRNCFYSPSLCRQMICSQGLFGNS